jgi:hypothetical protein
MVTSFSLVAIVFQWILVLPANGAKIINMRYMSGYDGITLFFSIEITVNFEQTRNGCSKIVDCSHERR